MKLSEEAWQIATKIAAVRNESGTQMYRGLLPESYMKLRLLRQDLQDKQDVFAKYGKILFIRLILSEK